MYYLSELFDLKKAPNTVLFFAMIILNFGRCVLRTIHKQSEILLHVMQQGKALQQQQELGLHYQQILKFLLHLGSLKLKRK